MKEHPDPEIEAQFVRLKDLLTMWERETGRQSVLVYREQGGFSRRLQNGITVDDDSLTDDQLLRTIS